MWGSSAGAHVSADQSNDAFDDEENPDRSESAHREDVGVAADPQLGPFDRAGCPVRSDRERSERHLEQPEHHQVEGRSRAAR
jgi:hypothetical protein